MSKSLTASTKWNSPTKKTIISESLPTTSKRIILCCDGTWQSSTSLRPESSNVTRLCRLIARGGSGRHKEHDGAQNESSWTQVVYYHGGVGSGRMSWWSRIVQGSLGVGFMEELIAAYNFIVNNYCEGDELFFFGFSRGAHTVRSVAGMICDIGVLTPDSMPYFPEIFKIYQGKPTGTPIEQISAWNDLCTKYPQIGVVHDREGVIIQVIGVWDTVGALGIPVEGLFSFSRFRKPYEFLNTRLEPQVKHAYQALALDEERAAYSPTLWTWPKTSPESQPRTYFCQTWFPGAHINIGGGGQGTDALSNITLAWMLDRIQPYLAIEWDRVKQEFQRSQGSVDTLYGSGPIQQQHWLWGLFGSKVRTPGAYHDNTEYTVERIHPSVHFRQQRIIERKNDKEQEYKPKSLNDRQRILVVGPQRNGFQWVNRDSKHYLWEFELGSLPKARSAERMLIEISSRTEAWAVEVLEQIDDGWKEGAE